MNNPGFSGMQARFLLAADDGCPRYALQLRIWQGWEGDTGSNGPGQVEVRGRRILGIGLT